MIEKDHVYNEVLYDLNNITDLINEELNEL